MIDALKLLAYQSADSPINVWLRNNPLVLGGIAIVLGALMALTGVIILRTGVAKNKLGMEFRGRTAKVSGYLRLLFGVAIIFFGLYKMIVR
jgi:hypothetical protein